MKTVFDYLARKQPGARVLEYRVGDTWLKIQKDGDAFHMAIGTTSDSYELSFDKHDTALEETILVLIGSSIRTIPDGRGHERPYRTGILSKLAGLETLQEPLQVRRIHPGIEARFTLKGHNVRIHETFNARMVKALIQIGTTIPTKHGRSHARAVAFLLDLADEKQSGEESPLSQYKTQEDCHTELGGPIALCSAYNNRNQAARYRTRVLSLIGKPINERWVYHGSDFLEAVIDFEDKHNPVVRFGKILEPLPAVKAQIEAQLIIKTLANEGKVLWPSAPYRSRKLLRKVQARVTKTYFKEN